MTDPISDLLARIRNAILSRKASLDVPASKMKKKVAEILRDEGYLSAVSESEGEHNQGKLTLTLRWDTGHKAAITGIKRISTPGQRAYVHADGLPTVRGGLGTAIISTSKGLMTDKQARKAKVGGEVICEVW
jgi:small subunit ribosomal protein S8